MSSVSPPNGNETPLFRSLTDPDYFPSQVLKFWIKSLFKRTLSLFQNHEYNWFKERFLCETMQHQACESVEECQEQQFSGGSIARMGEEAYFDFAGYLSGESKLKKLISESSLK